MRIRHSKFFMLLLTAAAVLLQKAANASPDADPVWVKIVSVSHDMSEGPIHKTQLSLAALRSVLGAEFDSQFESFPTIFESEIKEAVKDAEHIMNSTVMASLQSINATLVSSLENLSSTVTSLLAAQSSQIARIKDKLSQNFVSVNDVRHQREQWEEYGAALVLCHVDSSSKVRLVAAPSLRTLCSGKNSSSVAVNSLSPLPAAHDTSSAVHGSNAHGVLFQRTLLNAALEEARSPVRLSACALHKAQNVEEYGELLATIPSQVEDGSSIALRKLRFRAAGYSVVESFECLASNTGSWKWDPMTDFCRVRLGSYHKRTEGGASIDTQTPFPTSPVQLRVAHGVSHELCAAGHFPFPASSFGGQRLLIRPIFMCEHVPFFKERAVLLQDAFSGVAGGPWFDHTGAVAAYAVAAIREEPRSHSIGISALSVRDGAFGDSFVRRVKAAVRDSVRGSTMHASESSVTHDTRSWSWHEKLPFCDESSGWMRVGTYTALGYAS